MYTRHGAGGRRRPRGTAERRRVTVVEHSAFCAAGLVAAGLLALLFYPVLVAVTRSLYLLSSTAIVVTLLSVWFLVWAGSELVWEWGVGASGDREG